jgi:hypothetical protein
MSQPVSAVLRGPQICAQRGPRFCRLHQPAGDVDTLIDRYSSRQAVTGRKRKREREPLTSVIKLLPEYLPEELYSSSDKRYMGGGAPGVSHAACGVPTSPRADAWCSACAPPSLYSSQSPSS